MIKLKNNNKKLKTFKFNSSDRIYEYQNDFEISHAPKDADWERFAMLHDGKDFRLYCFKRGSFNTIYQFAFNGSAYEFGYNSMPEVKIKGIPKNADVYSINMLHDRKDYCLYMQDLYKLYQFVFDGEFYVYSDEINVTGLSHLIDGIPTGMLYGNGSYHFYALEAMNNSLYQAVYYEECYSYNRVRNVPIGPLPDDVNTSSFGMAYGQNTYWLYFLDNDSTPLL